MSIKTKILVLILLTITGVFAMKILLQEPEKEIREEKLYWIKKTNVTSKYNLIIGGDSRTYRGISPSMVTKGLGANNTAINLGYSSAGLSPEYLQFLTSKFSVSSDKKILILGITANSFTPTSFTNEHLNQYLSYPVIDRIKLTTFDKLYAFFPVYKPLDIVKQLTSRGSNNLNPNDINQTFYSDGWVRSTPNSIDSSRAIVSYKKTFSKEKFDQQLFSSFIHSVRLLVNEGIQVYAFSPPTTSEMKNLEQEMAEYNPTEVQKKIQSAGVIWLETRDLNYVSYDGSHLIDSSAERYSYQLGLQIASLSL